MGRPKKSKVASRRNGAEASNKGKVKVVETQLCGEWVDGVYVVKQWKQPVFAYRKGEAWYAQPGGEQDVFTVCAFYGRCILFDLAHVYSDRAPKDQEAKRWWAAEVKGTQLRKKYCTQA